MRPLEGHLLRGVGRRITRSDGDIERFMMGAVEITGLTAISPYTVIGDHGFVVIAESHVSVHIEGRMAFVHVFSCRAFPCQQVAEFARYVFKGRWRFLTPARRDADRRVNGD